jgi:(p)ppGpp synthase/HD superfamily hydrolase
MLKVLNAINYATIMHGDQKRKYTNEPYMVHCLEVAKIIAERGFDEDMICAAVLHDTLEDTKATYVNIVDSVGSEVAEMVRLLTNVNHSFGNRAARKAMDFHRISQAPVSVQNIKIADLISNTRTIVEYDSEFAKLYLKEKRELLTMLSPYCDVTLYSQACMQVSKGFDVLGITTEGDLK